MVVSCGSQDKFFFARYMKLSICSRISGAILGAIFGFVTSSSPSHSRSLESSANNFVLNSPTALAIIYRATR